MFTDLYSCRWFIVIVLFTARGAAAGFFQTVYVYTPEVYTTKLRDSIQLNFNWMFNRIFNRAQDTL